MVTIEKINYYKPHWHDNELSFVMILSGSIEAHITHDKYLMSSGDILIICPKDVHSFIKTEEDNLVLFIRLNCKLLESEFPDIQNWKLIGNPETEKQNHEDFERLRFLIIGTALDQSTEKTLIRFTHDNFLFSKFIQRKQSIYDSTLENFLRLDDYIKQKLSEPITIGDAAEYIGLSLYETAKMIKSLTKMEFSDYLNYLRCITVERLLVSSDLPLDKISKSCGFLNIKILNSCFKKLYGCTPEKLRQNNDSIFPEGALSSIDKYDISGLKIKALLRSYIKSDARTIKLDMNKLPLGMEFMVPPLGIADSLLDTDNCKNIPQFIDNLLEKKQKTVKQTDYAGHKVFHGDCGLSTNCGIKKPVFHIYEFLTPVNKIIIKEEGIAIGLYRNGIRILIFPSKYDDNRKRNEVFRILISSIEHDCIIKYMTIDKNNGNPHEHWKELGSPAKLNKDIEELLILHAIPRLKLQMHHNQSNLELNIVKPDTGVILIDISPFD